MRRVTMGLVAAALVATGAALYVARHRPAPRVDLDAEALEYAEACEREHRSWCRECGDER